MSESGIEFGVLPPKSPRGLTPPYGKWARIADCLRERPGEWAKVATAATVGGASSTIAQIKNGRQSKAMQPPGSFEAARRGRDVWARYVGDRS